MPHTVVLQAFRGAQSTRKKNIMSCAAEGHCDKVGAHALRACVFFTLTRNNQKSLTRVRVSVVVPTLI